MPRYGTRSGGTSSAKTRPDSKRGKGGSRREDGAPGFLLEHELYKSHRAGATIDKRFLMLSFPCRWKYDILRALNWFARASRPYDPRMGPALEVLAHKRRADGTWPVQNRHPGAVHFDMEETGGPSRWNTLRAARVMAAYGGDGR